MRAGVIALALVMGMSQVAHAQPNGNNGNGRGPGGGPPAHAGGPPGQAGGPASPPRGGGDFLDTAFEAGVESTIRQYFDRHSVAPQGLPPGIAKNYARGKPLPPGIAKRYVPNDLRTQLPAYEGYELLMVDRDVLLVSAATGIVADILFDVL